MSLNLHVGILGGVTECDKSVTQASNNHMAGPLLLALLEAYEPHR